jgi:hypothetical protein
MAPCKRLVYLETLSLSMADQFVYTQATSPKYSVGLKRIAELLAKEGGGTFAKVWRPKTAASVFSKLYFRRGQTQVGWLTDAVQGRINCDSADAVQQVAAYFRSIADVQQKAVKEARRPGLNEMPDGTNILAYDLSTLLDSDSGKPVAKVGTFLKEASPEGAVNSPWRNVE